MFCNMAVPCKVSNQQYQQTLLLLSQMKMQFIFKEKLISQLCFLESSFFSMDTNVDANPFIDCTWIKQIFFVDVFTITLCFQLIWIYIFDSQRGSIYLLKSCNHSHGILFIRSRAAQYAQHGTGSKTFISFKHCHK